MAGEKGKGGIRHQAIQRLLADYFRRQGMVAIIEAFIGKNVDIMVSDNDKTIAVEIQLSSKHYFQITKDYELGCDEVWIICESKTILKNIQKKVKKTLNGTLFNKTKFHLVEDFIPLKNNKKTGITRKKNTE